MASTVTLVDSGGQLIDRVQVMDVAGRMMLDQTPGSAGSLITIDVQRLQPGYYLFRFSSGNRALVLPFIKL